MRGRNRDDVARYKELYFNLYQAQLTLDAQAACPNGHRFSDGFVQDGGQGGDRVGGRVVEINVSVHIEPDGRVVCRLCRNKRAAHYRQQVAEGKVSTTMTRDEESVSGDVGAS